MSPRPIHPILICDGSRCTTCSKWVSDQDQDRRLPGRPLGTSAQGLGTLVEPDLRQPHSRRGADRRRSHRGCTSTPQLTQRCGGNQRHQVPQAWSAPSPRLGRGRSRPLRRGAGRLCPKPKAVANFCVFTRGSRLLYACVNERGRSRPSTGPGGTARAVPRSLWGTCACRRAHDRTGTMACRRS
jgi:hypothetical protein